MIWDLTYIVIGIIIGFIIRATIVYIYEEIERKVDSLKWHIKIDTEKQIQQYNKNWGFVNDWEEAAKRSAERKEWKNK